VNGVLVLDRAWNPGGCLLCSGGIVANLGVGIPRGLPLGGGVSFGDLSLFTACGSFSYGCCFGAACGFYTLSGSGASGFFRLEQSAAHGGVGIFGLMGAGDIGCVTCGRVSSGGGRLCFGLGKEGLLADLLSCAMPQLSAILAARCGEIAILCSVKIGPGVQDCYIFGGLVCHRIIDPVRLA